MKNKKEWSKLLREKANYNSELVGFNLEEFIHKIQQDAYFYGLRKANDLVEEKLCIINIADHSTKLKIIMLKHDLLKEMASTLNIDINSLMGGTLPAPLSQESGNS